MRHLASLLFLFLIMLPKEAYARQRYRAVVIERLAAAVGIKNVSDTLSDGCYISRYEYRGHKLNILVNAGQVTHIGYSLFPQSILSSSPVFNFIERYSLMADLPQVSGKSATRMCMEDDVKFRKGSLKMIKALPINNDISVSVAQHSGKYIEVRWKRESTVLCYLIMPLDYKLLSGMDVGECQNVLLDDLLDFYAAEPEPDSVNTEMLMKLIEPNYYVEKGEDFFIPALTNNKFYKETKTGTFELLYSEHHPIESLANLLITSSIDNKIQAKIKFVMFDFKNRTIEIPLTSLLSYLKLQNCKNYFGVMEKTDKTIVVELLATNVDEGYCHTIKLDFNTASIASKTGTIEGRMNCFIPLSKIKNIFQN